MSSTSRDSGALEALASAEFGKLYPAESQLVIGAPTPTVVCCGFNPPVNVARLMADPSYLPEFSETGNPAGQVGPWSSERNVRAELIRWLCVKREAQVLVNATGIQLLGARIVGSLDLSWTEVPFRVSLKRCRLTAPAFFVGCQILELDLEGCWTGPINADSIRVKQNFNLRYGFHADGLVTLVGAQIGGTLGCGEGVFIGRNGIAINADLMNVAGAILLRGGTMFDEKIRPFRAEGGVRLEAAKVGSDVDCNGGEFNHPYTAGNAEPAIDLKGAEIKGTLYLRAHSGKDGQADLPLKVNGLVDLQGASAGSFEDDRDSWKTLKLNLYGFVYRRITSEPRDASYSRDAKARLTWLDLDISKTTEPYRQLAKVLADTGDETGAKRVYEAMEAKISRNNDLAPLRWAKATIGYGYKPENAVYLLGGLTALGWLLYWRSYRMGSIVPTDKEARASFKPARKLPDYYPRFSPFFCSLENTFPLITFGQAEKWQADPESAQPVGEGCSLPRFLAWTKSASFMRTFIWIQIILGWLFATLFVAGVSGVVKHD